MPVTEYRRQWGAGLIEVLVAFSLFTVGVMGSFGMQIEAKKINYRAAQQSVATNLARDIIARMRANHTLLDAYAVEDFTGENLPEGQGCTVEACDGAQLVVRDFYEWGSSLNGVEEQVSIEGAPHNSGGLLLPVACIENDEGSVSVTISWGVSDSPGDEPEPGCGEGLDSTSGLRSRISLKTYIGRLQ